jgi:hypothetical protein
MGGLFGDDYWELVSLRLCDKGDLSHFP